VDIPANARVVLEVKGNLLFSGVSKGLQTVSGRPGIVVETDPTTGLSVFCPGESIQEITIVPMPQEED